MWPSWMQRWQRAPVWLGLSVNAHSLTLVEGADPRWPPAPGQRWVQAAWTSPHNSALSSDPFAGMDLVALGTAVRTQWQRAGMCCRRLAMGVPADRVVQQSLQLEADVPAHEVRAQVQWSASQALGLEWSEVAFDVRLEPPLVQHGLETSAVQTVHWLACPRAWVQAAQQMSRVAQLRLQFLGVEPVDGPASDPGIADAAQKPAPVQWHKASEMARQGALT